MLFFIFAATFETGFASQAQPVFSLLEKR